MLRHFWQSTIGKKVVMAATGLIMVGFVVGHALGNLLIFQGPERVNAYAAFLKSTGGALWVVRGVLLASVVLHAVAAVQLTRRARAARPVGYEARAPQVSTLASKTIGWGGALLAVFIVYHLLHFTFGGVHPSFSHADVYSNMIVGFSNPVVSAFYIVAMAALGLHLYHGVWSSMRTMGVSPGSPHPLHRRVALVLAVLVWLGFTVIPVAVLAKVVE